MSGFVLPATAPASVPRRVLSREFLYRVALSAAAVGICYLFSWPWLRTLTCDANLALDRVCGVHLTRISSDSVLWNGRLCRYVIACTFADVWCGALAWLWDLRSSVARNLLSITRFTCLLFAFNIVRLTLSDVLVAHGTPWWLGHNLLSGLCYYAIWCSLSQPTAPWRLAAGPFRE